MDFLNVCNHFYMWLECFSFFFFPLSLFLLELLTIFSDMFLMMLPIYDEIVCWKIVNTVLCDCIHYKSHSTAPCHLMNVSPDAWWPLWEGRDGYRAATVACLPAATVHTEWTVRKPGRQEESKYLQILLRCADKPRHLGQYSGTDAPLLTEYL